MAHSNNVEKKEWPRKHSNATVPH